MKRLAEETLPSGFSYEWTDLSYQQVTGGNAGLYVFPICVLFVFLVLAAQYGSWSLPFAVILIVPMCLLAATIGVRIMGQDVNILTQIGFVVLVGLAAKNAILIVEFARDIELRAGRLDAVSRPAAFGASDPDDVVCVNSRRAALVISPARDPRCVRRSASLCSSAAGVTLFGLIFTRIILHDRSQPADSRAACAGSAGRRNRACLRRPSILLA